jgi:hypothetical protein
MNAIKLTVLTSFLFLSSISFAQDNIPGDMNGVQTRNSDSAVRGFDRRVNFYVVNKPRTLDLFSRLVILRARKKGMTRRHKFLVVVARSSKEMKDKIEDYLLKKKAVIGSLWLDTHGHYKNGYSSFILGKDEFSYKAINDTSYTANLRALANYCDKSTKVAIGSCYSGATYEKPAHNGRPASRMNGDSLMIGLANVLPNTTIYGTEGWVMTKPGIFQKHKYALAGYPLQKRVKDEVYRPVWEHMGVWHAYSTLTKKFDTIRTLALTRMGSIHIKAVSYLERQKARNKLARNLKKLRPNLIKS